MHTFEKFEALSLEKRHVIINAAMDEFLKGGYEKASMNRLVEKAGISKGSLFYYFHNKKMLYLYLFDYTMTLVLETASKNTDEYDDDFINRILLTVRRNIEILGEHPRLFAFMNGCKAEQCQHVIEGIDLIKRKCSEDLFKALYMGVNKSLFRVDIDVEIAIYTIKTTMFQQLHDYTRQEDIREDDVLKKLEAFAIFFRKTFYR